MALAARSERAPAPRTQQRAGGSAGVAPRRRPGTGRSSARADRVPLIGAAPAATQRPSLVVAPRRRRTARTVGFISAGVIVLMLGAVALQVQLARRQMTLDVLDRRIREAHQTYDVLRRERAELRSPGRLVEQATLLGMSPPTETEYVALDPEVVAAVQRSGTHVDGDSNDSIATEFSDYALVKSRAGGAP